MRVSGARAQRCLHHFRGGDAHDVHDVFELADEELYHPQQEDFLLAVLFVEDAVLMVEVREGLRDTRVGCRGYSRNCRIS